MAKKIQSKLTFYKDNKTEKKYSIKISMLVSEFLEDKISKMDMIFERRFIYFLNEYQLHSSFDITEQEWKIINNEYINQKSIKMKTKIEGFKKETTDTLNTLLEREETSATDRAAIRKVLKEREGGNAASTKKSTDKKDAPLKVVGKDSKKETAKPAAKKADKNPAAKKEKAPKKPGVIATIFNSIKDSSKPVTEAQILAKLQKAFPDKDAKAMTSTIKVQIGSNKRPVRMEREKDVTFKIEVTKKGVKSFSL